MANLNKYLNSNQVLHVYPTAFRGTTSSETGGIVAKLIDPEAQLATEANLTDVINHLIQNKSFVINRDTITTNGEISSDIIEFIIHGYYFKCQLVNNDSADNGNDFSYPLYASIVVADKAEEDPYSTDNIWGYKYASLVIPIIDTENIVSNFDRTTNLDSNATIQQFQGLLMTNFLPTYNQPSSSENSSIPSNMYTLQLLDENGNIPELSKMIFDANRVYDPSAVDSNGNYTGKSILEQIKIIFDKLNSAYGNPEIEFIGNAEDIEVTPTEESTIELPYFGVNQGLIQSPVSTSKVVIKPSIAYGTVNPEDYFVNGVEPTNGMIYVKYLED